MLIQDTIDQLTRKIRIELDLSKKLNISYGEETITDLVLMELAKLNNYNLRIFQTPKHLEKYKGTDWEWFIGSQNYGWTRFAIQAKKYNSSSEYYDSLSHKVGKPPNEELQIKILERYSQANRAIPLYTFYNNYGLANKDDHWHCKKDFDSELLGWTVTPLENVEYAINNRGCRNFDHIHKKRNSLPVKCLLDCPLLIRKYQNSKQMIVDLFGTKYEKLQRLPNQFMDRRDIMMFDELPEELYNKEIQIYPKRIAIITLE